MNVASPWLRGPNLTFTLVALALILLFPVVEHVYEWPFPLRRNADR